MSVHDITLMLMALFGGLVVAEPCSRLLRLPQPTILVLLGFAGSELLIALGGDTGVRAGSFHDLIFMLFLPLLVFEAAFRTDHRRLLDSLGLTLPLAIFGMIATTLVCAALLYLGIGHPSGFPWMAALLTGVILAATDPIAVVAQMQRLQAAKRLQALLEGESLFNDATAIVLFSIFLLLAQMPAAELSMRFAIGHFFLVFGGGLVVGFIAGMLSGTLMPALERYGLCSTLSLLTAFGSYGAAEQLGVSGVMAALLAGLVCARRARAGLSTSGFERIDNLWETLGQMANGMVFLLMGIVISIDMFRERWLAMLIAVAAILLARMLAIYAVAALFSPLAGRIHRQEKLFLGWGGLRGAVTLALGLSLPTDLDYWWTIQSIAFGAVTFSIFVQAPTAGFSMRQLGLTTGRPAS